LALGEQKSGNPGTGLGPQTSIISNPINANCDHPSLFATAHWVSIRFCVLPFSGVLIYSIILMFAHRHQHNQPLQPAWTATAAAAVH